MAKIQEPLEGGEPYAFAGYSLNANNYTNAIAPDDNFVAFLHGYSSGPGVGAGLGIFASDGSVVAYTGETIGGVTVNQFLYGPDVSSTHSVLFAAYLLPAAGQTISLARSCCQGR